ncbi:MAG: hypothetical protein H7X95_14765, partial [Deltaproteobacteria bacterium]|nr:hypothetical protein [Deltaproteobacteria bacterium]
NRDQIPYFELAANHRAHLTALVTTVATPGARLCVLGAGNCYDLDIERMATLFAEVHLVDLDPDALARAWKRINPLVRPRVIRHAPVDLTGMLSELGRWRSLAVSEEEVRLHPGVTAAAINALVGGPFEVVVSACVLTQMQLSILEALSDQHPLFVAARETVNLTHLRTLSRMLTPGGFALLATDVTSSHTYPLGEVDGIADLRPLLNQLVAAENVFQAVHPARWHAMVVGDPVLTREVRLSKPLDVWLWQINPMLAFLVYAFALRRHDAPAMG